MIAEMPLGLTQKIEEYLKELVEKSKEIPQDYRNEDFFTFKKYAEISIDIYWEFQKEDRKFLELNKSKLEKFTSWVRPNEGVIKPLNEKKILSDELYVIIDFLGDVIACGKHTNNDDTPIRKPHINSLLDVMTPYNCYRELKEGMCKQSGK